MKKTIMFILMGLIFLSFDVVNAEDGQLKPEEISVTCVYENGLQLEAFYESGAYGLFASDIKVKNMVNPPISTGVTVFYNEAKIAKEIVGSGKCPDKIEGGMVAQWKKKAEDDNYPDDSLSTTFALYAVEEDHNKLICDGKITGWNGTNALYCSGSTKFDKDFFKSNHTNTATASPDYGYWNRVSVGTGSAAASKCIEASYGCLVFKFNLINEYVEINTETQPLGQWAFKSEGDQAASKVMYAKVYKYKMPNGNIQKFAEKDNHMTWVNAKDPDKSGTNEVWLCLNPTSKSIEDSAFSYSGTRHLTGIESIPAGKNVRCTGDGYTLYKEVDWNEVPETGDSMTSICDIIPETALILAEFTQWARIIVPAFLIILTGFDISKIVINGNLEEELPKRRKHIIIRAVVALIFFFLPLFVQAIIGVTQGVDFGDVSCIWN